jgi:hypothetical protein
MSDEKERRRILTGLLDQSIPLEQVRNGLAGFSWDSESELVVFTCAHLRGVLRRFLNGELSADEVAAWAEAIECREDIGNEVESLGDAVYELATPESEGVLTHARALALLDQHGEPK